MTEESNETTADNESVEVQQQNQTPAEQLMSNFNYRVESAHKMLMNIVQGGNSSSNAPSGPRERRVEIRKRRQQLLRSDVMPSGSGNNPSYGSTQSLANNQVQVVGRSPNSFNGNTESGRASLETSKANKLPDGPVLIVEGTSSNAPIYSDITEVPQVMMDKAQQVASDNPNAKRVTINSSSSGSWVSEGGDHNFSFGLNTKQKQSGSGNNNSSSNTSESQTTTASVPLLSEAGRPMNQVP